MALREEGLRERGRKPESCIKSAFLQQGRQTARRRPIALLSAEKRGGTVFAGREGAGKSARSLLPLFFDASTKIRGCRVFHELELWCIVSLPSRPFDFSRDSRWPIQYALPSTHELSSARLAKASKSNSG
jgi:hypothetical protein